MLQLDLDKVTACRARSRSCRASDRAYSVRVVLLPFRTALTSLTSRRSTRQFHEAVEVKFGETMRTCCLSVPVGDNWFPVMVIVRKSKLFFLIEWRNSTRSTAPQLPLTHAQLRNSPTNGGSPVAWRGSKVSRGKIKSSFLSSTNPHQKSRLNLRL